MNTVTADVRPAKIDAQSGSSSDQLELASELLEALGGSLGVLAGFLEKLDNIGSDTPLAVYAAGHIVDRVREIVGQGVNALMAYERAKEGR